MIEATKKKKSNAEAPQNTSVNYFNNVEKAKTQVPIFLILGIMAVIIVVVLFFLI